MRRWLWVGCLLAFCITAFPGCGERKVNDETATHKIKRPGKNVKPGGGG
jgi:hypothetical protein